MHHRHTPTQWAQSVRELLPCIGLMLVCAAILGGCSTPPRAERPRAAAPHTGSPAAAQPIPHRDLPGVGLDGRVQLSNQWSLQPTGRQVELGDLPVNMAVHPNGRYLAVLHAGYGPHEVIVLELTDAGAVVRSRTGLEATFYGVCFNADGSRLYCSGGTRERIESFAFQDGLLSDRQQLPVATGKVVTVPAGLAASADGRTVYAAGNRGHCLVAVATTGEAPPIRVSLPAESFPYACVLDEPRGRLYVSLWGQAAVAVFDLPLTAESQPRTTMAVQDHPNEMLLTRDGSALYVANANRNTVSVIDTASGQTREILSSALYPNAPNGSTPNSIALSPDERTLYIANADNNNVAVLDVSEPRRSRSCGFIPVGWYPTSVRVAAGGARLLVANGKGTTPRANRQGPNPLRRAATVEEYIAGLYQGTLSVIDAPPPGPQLKALTAQAYQCSPLRADLRPVVERPPGNPIPAALGEPSPIRYCLYIIKENRTYDQVLGDMPEGNGDADLCIFGEEVTPNHHALAREFVLLDNFYVESEVSADGHEWTVGAYATDFVEKNWPINYSGRGHGRIGYPAEGSHDIAAPSEGYIWDRCAQAGITYRSYGEFVSRKDDGVIRADVATLEEHFDPQYEPYNLNYADVGRAARFISELQRFEAEGEMPRFQVLRLPNNHTFGTRVGKPTPIAMVADNDLALGQIVAAVSRSRFWPQTAIFVVEDDAQNGSDHVDAHRTVAFVISPHVRRGTVDSSLYSTSSMLRTMELILGLQPLSQFDAAARPMYACFGPQPDLRPYDCRPAQVDRSARNSPLAWGAQTSAELDLSREDAADDLLFNEIIWRSVRGPDSPMPPPVRAAFVLAEREDEDADGDRE